MEFVNGMRCRNLSTDYQQVYGLEGSQLQQMREHGLGLQVNRLHTVTGNPARALMVEPRRIIFRCIHPGNWDDVQNGAGRFVVCEYDSVQPKLTPVAKFARSE